MKINQSETAIAHYHDPESEMVFTGIRALTAAVFLGGLRENWTLLEIVSYLNVLGYEVNDSTISPRLHELRGIGVITDENPKRPCSVNSIRKKVWSLAEGAESKLTVTVERVASGDAEVTS